LPVAFSVVVYIFVVVVCEDVKINETRHQLDENAFSKIPHKNIT
jgi:hypothetical protein